MKLPSAFRARRAVGRLRKAAHNQSTTVAAGRVAVAKHAGSRDRQSRVFGCGVAVINSSRQVVHRCHADRYRRGRSVAIGIRDGVGEAVRTVVVRIRRVGEAAVGVQGQTAVGRAA